jgi:hypothetical protein
MKYGFDYPFTIEAIGEILWYILIFLSAEIIIGFTTYICNKNTEE